MYLKETFVAEQESNKTVEPGEPFEIGEFRPEDAAGIVRARGRPKW